MHKEYNNVRERTAISLKHQAALRYRSIHSIWAVTTEYSDVHSAQYRVVLQQNIPLENWRRGNLLHIACPMQPLPFETRQNKLPGCWKSRLTENTRAIRRGWSQHNNGILALWWVIMATIDPPLVVCKHVMLLSLHPAVCYHHLSYSAMPVTCYTVMPTWW